MPFDALYGLEVLSLSPDEVRARVPVDGHLLQPLGMVHGGIYACIAEALASMGTNRGVATQGLVGLGQTNHTTFLRPVTGGEIRAVAHPRHRGRSTWIWDVECTDLEGRVCALARMTIAVRPLPT